MAFCWGVKLYLQDCGAYDIKFEVSGSKYCPCASEGGGDVFGVYILFVVLTFALLSCGSAGVSQI